ncbi:MAG: TIGR04211 family SH3 domain-containing protein, partial [Wohlfahrtiimonas sp.]
MSFRTHIITLLSLTVLCSTVSAQNVKYVTDQLQAPIRASGSDSGRIVKMLTSGEKIKIIGENKQHFEIQYGDNNAHGWIHKSFVMNDPAAREFVEMAKQEYAPLQDSIATLNTENDEKGQIIASLKENQKKLEQALLVQTNRVTHL